MHEQESTTDAQSAVVVITQPEDTTADLVVAELNERGVPLFRFDPGDFPTRVTLAATVGPSTRAWSGYLCSPTRRVSLSRIRSVYYRRPSRFRFDERMSEPEHKFADAQARHALSGLLAALPDARWLNTPGAMADARLKPRQLTVALECGFTVPASLVTNVPAELPAFTATAGDRIVTKPLGSAMITEDGAHGVAYTSHVTRPDIPYPEVATTAHFFQEHIPGDDVRLTMVTDDAFAAVICPHRDGGSPDIRAHHHDVDYRVITVPEYVRRRCRLMLDRFGLDFGAFDFKRTGEDWTFLELNPNGQWAFIPALRAPIASAIATVLVGSALDGSAP